MMQLYGLTAMFYQQIGKGVIVLRSPPLSCNSTPAPKPVAENASIEAPDSNT